jgi:hypothetical protein
MPMLIAMPSKGASLHVRVAVIREFLARPALIFHSVGLRTVVTQSNACYTAAAASNSIISILDSADAVLGAVAMQITDTQELAVSLKSRPIKALGFLLAID